MLQVRVNFNFFGLQGKVERVIHQRGMRDVFHRMHRLLLATMQEWFDMSMDEITAYEEQVAQGLEKIKASQPSPRSPSRSPLLSAAAPEHTPPQLVPAESPTASEREKAPEYTACAHCMEEVAVMHCADCGAEYCDDCHRVLHFNRKRRNHKVTHVAEEVNVLMLYGFTV